MKKIAMFFAAVAVATSAFAQGTAVTASKAADNWYVGINAGVSAPTTGYKVLENLTPELGVRVGKNFTTVFGLALDADMHFASMPAMYNTKTWVDNTNISLLGTANLSNLFAGYKGEPRCFEVIALGGFGWAHSYGIPHKLNSITSKVAVDFAVNLGNQKQWQLYLEPSLTYNLEDFACVEGYDLTQAPVSVCIQEGCMKYNINKSIFALKLGVNYKFGCSNGTHNFAIAELKDLAEIEALNAKINGLRNDLDAANAKEANCRKTVAAKDAEIAALKKALADCENKPVVTVALPNVLFSCNKSNIEKGQFANVATIAKYLKDNADAKVMISGYASPEGKAAANQKLSLKRAIAVKNMLVKKYGIAADRLETEGCGATDKLYDEVVLNRVAVLNNK